MKKVFFYCLLLACTFVINSCSPNNPTSPSGGTYSWNLIFDGQQRGSWSGPYPNTPPVDGGSAYQVISSTNPIGNLTFGSNTIGGIPPCSITVFFENVRTGVFVMNENTYNPNNNPAGNYFTIIFNSTVSNNEIYSSTGPGSNIIVEITTLSQNSVASSGPSGAGNVQGTFSGTIADASGNLHNISGAFNAIRQL